MHSTVLAGDCSDGLGYLMLGCVRYLSIVRVVELDQPASRKSTTDTWAK